MKIMSVVGARPNFMKVAPIIAAIDDYNNGLSRGSLNGHSIQHFLVHTGQHYDQLMSNSFFADLGLPTPDAHLGVGSGSHAVQTAEVMKKFEEVLLRERPDVLVVVGDVNSTIACALVAAKVSYDDTGTRPVIAHVEAGLRSFDRGMPEEINRILTDQISDLLFVTEESGLRNLAHEGVAQEKIHFVGNTMIDSLMAYRDHADRSPILDQLGLWDSSSLAERNRKRYALLTIHRPANVDTRDALVDILEGLRDLASGFRVIFPAHPRTRSRIRDMHLERYFEPQDSADQAGIRLVAPLGYFDFLCLMKNAVLVVTDSGGIQEETTCLGVPCVTVRDNTERPVTLTIGTNILAGRTESGIRAAIRSQLQTQPIAKLPELWDGHASLRILDVLQHAFAKTQSGSGDSRGPVPQAAVVQ
jgi:UDP-N-acetylglucosamine 2-epimerase (non-hydrolysing)